MFDERAVDVGEKMVDADDRLAKRSRKAFRIGVADEQGGNQARIACDGDGVQFAKLDIRFMHGGSDDGIDIFKMFARSQFGDDAAISRMERDLGGYDGRQDRVAVFDDGCGGFVAAAFDAENYHDG